MSEFDAFIREMTKEAAANTAEPVYAPAVSTPVAHTQEKTASDDQSALAAAILDAEDNLPDDLKEQADNLALLEAHNIVKQANFIKDTVQEALSMHNPKTASYDAENEAEALYIAAYKEASVNLEADELYDAAYKEASGYPESEAEALYEAAFSEATNSKTASDTAQLFVNGLVQRNYDYTLAGYAHEFKNQVLNGAQ